jgi:hypothetical protein
MENSLAFVVVGTDHRFQESSPEFDAILRSLTQSRFFLPLGAIAEEYSPKIGPESLAQRLASELQIPWFNIDMTTEERLKAGILEAQTNRPGMFQANVTYRIPSDDVREEAWVEKLIKNASGTTIVVCGYLHFDALVKKLKARGQTVDQRVFLEAVPEIRQA